MGREPQRLKLNFSAVRAAVAITGFEGLDVGGPGLSIARALKAASDGDVLLLALTSDSIASAGLMDGISDAAAIIPALADDADGAVDQIIKLSTSIPIRALIPGNNEHAHLLALSAGRLAVSGITTFLPNPEQFARLTAEGLREALGDLPIEVVSSGTFSSIEDALACSETLAYPTLVIARGQRRVVISPSELRSHLHRIGRTAPTKVRAVPFDYSSSYRVACLAEDGVMGPMVVSRTLGSTAAGAVAASTVVHDPAIAELAIQMVRALNWTGPLEFEMHRYSDASPLRLLWAECALPNWSMLTHWAGCNLASALLKRIETGMLPITAQARPGTIAARCTYETVLSSDMHNAFAKQRFAKHQTMPKLRRNGSDGPAVAVTGMSASDVINPGVGTSRCLRAGKSIGRVIGIGYTALDAAAYDSSVYDQVFRFDFPRTVASFKSQILNAAKTTRIDALLSCLDDELPYAMALSDELMSHGIATLLPSPEALERRSKTALFGGTLMRDWGAFLIPESVVVNREEDARKAMSHFGGRAVAKGARYLCSSIRSASEAAASWRNLRGQDSQSRIILQQLLDGPSYAVSVVCDRNHRVVSSLTIKKETLCPRGSTWGAVSVSEPQLEADFAAMLKELKWVGPAEGEFMLDCTSRRFHLIEINPRFTGWIFASPSIGPNQPEIAIRIALGLPFEATPPSPGKLFLRAADEIRISAAKRTFRHEHA